MTNRNGGSEYLLPELSESLAQLMKLDDTRQEVMKHLAMQFEKTKRIEEDLHLEVARLQAHERTLLQQRAELEEDKRQLQTKMDAAPFIVLLVDGDNTHFLDKFVQAGLQGGGAAAHALRQDLETYLQAVPELGFHAHWDMVVHIYANFHGLAQAFHNARVVDSTAMARLFFVGFNRTLPLSVFIDVGSDKEAADNQIKESLALFHKTPNCKRVMLAGSGDRGYVSYLRRFDDGNADITLVEATPFEPSFRALAERFTTIKFPAVFRETKLGTRPVPVAAVPTQTPEPTRSANTYAGAASSPQGPLRPVPVGPSTMTARTESTIAFSRVMNFNSDGVRIDEPIPKCKHVLFERFQAANPRPCARFHLTVCKAVSCADDHDVPVDLNQESALLRLARYTSCVNGLRCRDRGCVASHQCIYDYCFRMAKGKPCSFSPEMHNVDKTVVTTL